MSLCAFLRKAFFLEGDVPVLEPSTVIKRLLAIGMLGALAFLLSPEPTLGQSALKEKPPGYSHRFPPLPDKIQRLDAYRQRRERAGLLSKFVFWAAESGAEETIEGPMIIDMPSEGPVKPFFTSSPTIVHSGSVTVVEKPTLTITPSDESAVEAPKQVRREVSSKRPVDPNVKQASATKSNKNEFVHELVVPSATDPALPPLPDQVKAAPPRKPKVPMLRRVPEFSTTSVDDAIQRVDNVEKTSPHDLPAVRGVQQAVAMEPLVQPKKANEPELRPIVVTPEAAPAPTSNTQSNGVVTPKPAKSSVPRKLPNIVEEKKKTTVATKPKAVSKPIVKPTPKVAAKKPVTKPAKSPERSVVTAGEPERRAVATSEPERRVVAAGERPTRSGSTNRHPSMVRSDIKQTGGTSPTKTAVAASAPLKSTPNEPTESGEPSPRNLPDLDTTKELPPLPTEAEVAENQRKFEEALLKASKKSPEPKQEDPADLTLPSEPLQDESATPSVQIAEEAQTATEPDTLETEPMPTVTATEPTTPAPTEIEATGEPAPSMEVATPAPELEMPVESTAVAETPAAPAPVVKTVPMPKASGSPMPVAEQPVPMAAPMQQSMDPPAVEMEAATLPKQEPALPNAPHEMSREEALAGLEAMTSPETVAAPSASAVSPPVPVAISTQPMPAMTGSPMPSSLPKHAAPTPKQAMDPAFAEAQLELESMVHDATKPAVTVPNLKNAQDELEALAQGRPIPKTTSPTMPIATAEELLDAESELADLARMKGSRPVPQKSMAPPALPSSMNRPTRSVPKATSSTAPQKSSTPKTNAKIVAEASKKGTPKSIAEAKPTPSALTPDSAKPPSLTPSPPVVKGEPTKSASPAKSSSVVDSMKEKMPALPELPAPVEASSTKHPSEQIVMPANTLETTKESPAVAADRPPLKSTEVTKLADEIKKSKKASPNPSLFANTAKGKKDSGTSSSVLTSSKYENKPTSKPKASDDSKNDAQAVASTNKKADESKAALATSPVKPPAEVKVVTEKQSPSPTAASSNVATKPLATEMETPVLAPLQSGTEISATDTKKKDATPALPSSLSALPPKIEPGEPSAIASKKDVTAPAAERAKNPTAPVSGGLTFGLQAIEQGLLDATKPSKELAANGNAPPPQKPSSGPARFNVAKLETFDDPTAKTSAKPASLGRPKATPGLNPKDAIPLVPDDETVIEDPTSPTPFNDGHAQAMIKAIKESANCHDPLRDLTHMEYWYRASGAVEAVTHVARNNKDVALRINATRLLGTVPLTMSEATNSLKGLAKEATEPNVRETAEALLSERLASVPRSALR